MDQNEIPLETKPPVQLHHFNSIQFPINREDTMLHTTKRNRMSAKKEFPISKLLGNNSYHEKHFDVKNELLTCSLATLEKDKLIELINDLVDSNPHLKSEVDAFIPPPTTQSISLVITNLEKKLNDSFPFGKTSSRDEYSFNRVKAALLDVVVSNFDTITKRSS